MVQDQLVDYINSQIKLGVPRDAVKSTLVGAGWAAADVEDTLKKIESAKTGQAGPAAMSAGAAASADTAAKPVMIGATEPQTIKVSDLVSAAPSLSPSPSSFSGAKTAASRNPLTGPAAPASASASAATPAGVRTATTFQAASSSGMKPRGSHGALITEIILGVLVVIAGGLAGFLYMQNGSLSSQLSSLNGQSSGVNSQLARLQAQVAASTTALTAQVSTLTGESNELRTELAFFAVPPGMAPGATSTALLTGTVAAGRTLYVITAQYGAKIFVANSKSAAVVTALAPFLPGAKPAAASSTATGTTGNAATGTASTTMAETVPGGSAPISFTGTYVPGSDVITLTAVNGVSVQ